ncbi:DUF6807 family protein [Microbacterium radiodurans]|uniref:Gfo/Idh/MocA-like oxidoreductase N-terminal domain-containing protein n=1 Tax=Microbacterium radiodurans TaxID=661398 RepID=A0A5J5IUV3_9MICO|nr:DUF6807 family protein [Microbacterium radiodurans]KAA9089627.1 hypothetical protein F6B42_03910 [Microbacterium radiodurans]
MTHPITTIALVGVHGYGAVHLANLRRLGDRVRLIAVADPVPPAAGELPDRTRVFGDLTGLLAAADRGDIDRIDVVIVATPLHTHAALAATVLARGIDLYLEKPPVVSSSDFAALSDAAAASGARVQVGFQSLGSLALPALAADRFDIGAIQAVGAVGLWARDAAYWKRSRWAGRRELDGVAVVDGVVTNPLAHATATALAIAGATGARDVTQVTTDLYRANEIEGDDTSLVRVSTTAGIRVTSGLTLCAPEQVEPWVVVRGTRGAARFFYTADVVEAGGVREDFGRVDLLENLLDHRDVGTPLLAPLAATGAFVRVADAVRRTTPHPIDPEHLSFVGEGDARRPVVAGIVEGIERAVDAAATFAELHLPFAAADSGRVLATLRGRADGGAIAALRDGAGTAASSSPRPYLHPITTPGGVVVSDHHPIDHDWHLGLSVTLQDVDGANFWGGRTYTPGRDYIWRGDQGRIETASLTASDSTVDAVLRWVGPDGAPVLAEERTMNVTASDDRHATVDLTFTLAPAGERTVSLGSPGSNGRVGGGYGGLSWRLPACSDVDVRTADARGEDGVHGTASGWLAWSGVFSGAEATVGLAPLDEASRRDPWFVRVAGYPGIGASLAWAAPVETSAAEPVRRSYRLLVADGRLADDDVVRMLRV